MADTSLPVQELPPWLTYSTAIYTDPAGVLTTATTILQLPLTYYGPSIPLGPDWTYGGLTSPAPTSTVPSTTAPTIVTSLTTAIPTSTRPTATPTITSAPTFTPTSSATSVPTSISSTSTRQSSSSRAASSSAVSSSSTTSSSSGSSTASFSSALPTSTLAGASSHHGLSGRQITAIVLGVIAFALILLILVTCFVLRRRRRVRRSTLARSGHTWKDFAPVVPTSHSGSASSFIFAEDSRQTSRRAGEGSPRHSGDEADPLLRPSGEGAPAMAQRGGAAAVWAVNPANNQHIFLRHSRSTKSGGDGGDGSDPFADELGVAQERDISNHPGYGTPGSVHEDSPLLPPRPLDPDGLGLVAPPMAQQQDSGVDVDPQAPPRLVTIRRVQINDFGAFGSGPKTPSSDAFPSSESDRAQHGMRDMEKGALVADYDKEDNAGGSRTPNPTPATPTPRPGWLPNLGLARFSQLSWLSRVPSSPTPVSTRSRSRSRSRPSTPSGGAWAALAGEEGAMHEGSTSRRSRPKSGLLVPPGAERPRSTVSGKSGISSVYHSASESPVGSYGSKGSNAKEPPPPVPALPPAAAQNARDRGHVRTASPLMQQYTPPPPQEEPAAAPAAASAQRQAMTDILDMPAPSAHTTFSSSASSGRPRPTFLHIPPGLPTFPTPAVWADATGSGSASPSSLGHEIPSRYSTGGDALDAEPPRAGEVWRNLADARDRGRIANTSTPTVVHQSSARDSLLGSVHSHLSPAHGSTDSLPSHFSLRAEGTLPLSAFGSNSGSGSSRSRPSNQSRGPSGLSSLAHSRAASEDGRRRAAGDEPLSAAPSLSAFGIAARGAPPPSALRSGNPFAERLAGQRWSAFGDDLEGADHA